MSKASAGKLRTPVHAGRKRAALRLLRAREAAGVTQLELAERLGCSKRQYGAIERAEVRDIGLEALGYLLERLEGAPHAAAGDFPRGAKYALSRHTDITESVGRPASEARCASGSDAELGGTAAQPASFSIRRAA